MQQAASYPGLNPKLVIVDGAEGARTVNSIIPGGIYYPSYWSDVERRLSQAKINANQVQIVWLKDANPCPGQRVCSNPKLTSADGSWPGYAKQLEAGLEQVIAQLENRFPNLKQIFISPRTYGGYAVQILNPEPYAFETGFADKWLIENRIKSAKTTPWLDWGPYLWSNGTKTNPQGLSWSCDDFWSGDRTHPSKSGVQKVGKALLDFFSTDKTTCSWFNADSCK